MQSITWTAMLERKRKTRLSSRNPSVRNGLPVQSKAKTVLVFKGDKKSPFKIRGIQYTSF